MKNVKRILVAMLALSLLASAFMFSASAEENPFHNGMTSIEDILEYYTLDDYLADNYNDGTWTGSLIETDSE